MAGQGRVAAIGEEARIVGFALAGAEMVAAETGEAVRAAWGALDPDVVLVLLTPAAAAALAGLLDDPATTRLTAVLPA
ncbi:MAG: V-type ATP synthase subunit F [Blastococcus sp.]